MNMSIYYKKTPRQQKGSMMADKIRNPTPSSLPNVWMECSHFSVCETNLCVYFIYLFLINLMSAMLTAYIISDEVYFVNTNLENSVRSVTILTKSARYDLLNYCSNHGNRHWVRKHIVASSRGDIVRKTERRRKPKQLNTLIHSGYAWFADSVIHGRDIPNIFGRTSFSKNRVSDTINIVVLPKIHSPFDFWHS